MNYLSIIILNGIKEKSYNGLPLVSRYESSPALKPEKIIKKINELIDEASEQASTPAARPSILSSVSQRVSESVSQ